jgi:hypothetical protein
LIGEGTAAGALGAASGRPTPPKPRRPGQTGTNQTGAHPLNPPSPKPPPPRPQDGIDVEADCSCASVDWHATAAHLLPGRGGAAPTGLVSEIWGSDHVNFGPDGRISSIVSFRERFAEESDGEHSPMASRD